MTYLKEEQRQYFYKEDHCHLKQRPITIIHIGLQKRRVVFILYLPDMIQIVIFMLDSLYVDNRTENNRDARY